MSEVRPEQPQTPPTVEQDQTEESLSRTEKFLEYFGRWDDKHHYTILMGSVFTSGAVGAGIVNGSLWLAPIAGGLGLAVGMLFDRQENKAKAKRLNRANGDE